MFLWCFFHGLGGVLGAFWGSHLAFMGPLRCHEARWRILGLSWDTLGPLWGRLVPLFGVVLPLPPSRLGLSCGRLAVSIT